jgi:ribosome modulation factor
MHDRTIYLNEGMEAGLDGLPLHGCPYPAGSKEQTIWTEGWKCAAEDDAPQRGPAPSVEQALSIG